MKTGDRFPDGIDRDKIAEGVRLILDAIGEDASRAGLRETPQRVAESYAELFSGIAVDPASVLEPLPGERGDGLIMVRDIPLTGMCEHHLLPFIGTAAVAYLPGEDGRICGLSKLARVVAVLSRRPQVQERLVADVADAMEKALSPRAVFVYVEAEHLCMTMRGAQKPGSITVTSEWRGLWREEPGLRAEVIALARSRE
ncbi:MAG: GTP cyclohydrolase I FolE [Actinobacteria bacterium]|nr:GTP cyclohydrolase I FolE [Actinomycetota bacterium]